MFPRKAFPHKAIQLLLVQAGLLMAVAPIAFLEVLLLPLVGARADRKDLMRKAVGLVAGEQSA
jgi:hypothetical protein